MNKFATLFLFILFLFGFVPSSVDAANRFAVCTVTCTWDGASTAMWSTTTGGATGASVPGSADSVVIDAATCVGGVTCTITTNTNPTVLSITFGACTAATSGCILDFSANNNTPTITSSVGLSGTGTGTRTLNCGNGTWSFTAAAVLTFTVTTNLTFNCASATFAFSGSQAITKINAGGGLTYGTITVAANALRGGISWSGSNTFGAYTITGPNSVQFTNGTTNTFTNGFTWTGTASNPIYLGTTSNISLTTMSMGVAATGDWMAIRGVTVTGAGSLTATNSFDLGVNTNVSISVPSGGGGMSGQLRPGIGQ